MEHIGLGWAAASSPGEEWEGGEGALGGGDEGGGGDICIPSNWGTVSPSSSLSLGAGGVGRGAGACWVLAPFCPQVYRSWLE